MIASGICPTLISTAREMKTSVLNLLLVSAFLVALVLGCASSNRTSNYSPSSKPTPRRSTSENASSAVKPKPNNWGYSEYGDEMGRGRIFQTSTRSTNTISLGFPYEGEQHCTLSIREHPQHGSDVYLSIEKGQLLDSEYHGKVLVRFDEDKAIAFPSVGPADLSSDTLFLRGNAFPVFIRQLKTVEELECSNSILQLLIVRLAIATKPRLHRQAIGLAEVPRINE